MREFSLREVILGLRKSYLDVNYEYKKLKDDNNIFIAKKNTKKVYFYFGKDEYGRDNFVCSIIDILNPYDQGKKDIVYKSYSNDYIIQGNHNYRIEVIDNKKFYEIAEKIFNSKFMKYKPKTIDLNDKQIEITPSYIELNFKGDDKDYERYASFHEPFEHNLKIKTKDKPIIVYKAIDDYILTTDLYDRNYLDEIVVNEKQLDEYHARIIKRYKNLSLSNPELLLDNNSEYNILKNRKGYSLALRPNNSTHID